MEPERELVCQPGSRRVGVVWLDDNDNDDDDDQPALARNLSRASTAKMGQDWARSLTLSNGYHRPSLSQCSIMVPNPECCCTETMMMRSLRRFFHRCA